MSRAWDDWDDEGREVWAVEALTSTLSPLVNRRIYHRDVFHLRTRLTTSTPGRGADHKTLPLARLGEALGQISVSDGKVTVPARMVALCAARDEGGPWRPHSAEVHGPPNQPEVPIFARDALATHDVDHNVDRGPRSCRDPRLAPLWLRELAAAHAVDLDRQRRAESDGLHLTSKQAAETLARLGRPVSVRAIRNYTSRPESAPADWPRPAKYAGRTPLWAVSAIELYAGRAASAERSRHVDEPPF